MDGSQPRYYLPIYATLALLAALLLVDVVERLPRPRLRSTLAIAVVGCLVFAGSAQAAGSVQGTIWIAQHREWQNGYEQHARDLPPNAVLVGNYLSKIVYSRPVLVPDDARGFLPDAVTWVQLRGHPVYVDKWWAVRDENEFYGGDLLASGHHYFRATPVGNYTQVMLTNATVRNVYDFNESEWNLSAAAITIQPTTDRAHFRPIQDTELALPIEDWTVDNGTLSFTYFDGRANATYAIGTADRGNRAPTYLLHWSGNGSGTWRRISIPIHRALFVDGGMFFEGKPELSELSVVWNGPPPPLDFNFVPGTYVAPPWLAVVAAAEPIGYLIAALLVAGALAYVWHDRLRGRFPFLPLGLLAGLGASSWSFLVGGGPIPSLPIAVVGGASIGWLLRRTEPGLAPAWGFVDAGVGAVLGAGVGLTLHFWSADLRNAVFVAIAVAIGARILVGDPIARYFSRRGANPSRSTAAPD
jgi:hypothetical protein